MTLVDPAAVGQTVEDGILAALDVAALVEARASHPDGLRTGGGRPAADIAAETLEAFKGLQSRVDSKAVAGAGAVGGTAAAIKLGMTGGAAGLGFAGEALGVALQPAMEVAVIGTILALGAKNLLFAEDRKKFLEAMQDRDSLFTLLKENINATGLLPLPGGDAAASSAPAFDPLGLSGGFDAPAPTKLSIGKTQAKAAGGEGKEKGPSA